MNFIRPEVRAALWRWREVVFTCLLVLGGVRMLGRGVEQSSVVIVGIGLLIAGIAAALLFLAILRVKFHKPARAQGVIEVKEREIGYLGPDSGSFVSIDDLTRVEILTTDQGPDKDDAFWILSHLAGAPLLIPVSAQGTDQLFDAFAALPGVRMDEAVKAFSSTGNMRYLIWRKQG